MNDPEVKIIPKKVLELADYIKKCTQEEGPLGVLVSKRRRSGLSMAYRLAFQTEDTPPPATIPEHQKDQPHE